MNEFTLANRSFQVMEPGRPLHESELAAFETKLGTRLPPQLRSYYLRWNGGLPRPVDVPDDESVWVRLRWKEGTEAARVGPATSLQELFEVNADPPVDFFRTWTDFRHRIPSDCLCFARDPGGSLFLIGIQRHNLGRVYFWERSYEADLEGGESPSYDNIADVAESFEEFLLALREEPRTGESLEAYVRRVYS